MWPFRHKHTWYAVDGARDGRIKYLTLHCSTCRDKRVVNWHRIEEGGEYPDVYDQVMLSVLQWGPIKEIFE